MSPKKKEKVIVCPDSGCRDCARNEECEKTLFTEKWIKKVVKINGRKYGKVKLEECSGFIPPEFENDED